MQLRLCCTHAWFQASITNNNITFNKKYYLINYTWFWSQGHKKAKSMLVQKMSFGAPFSLVQMKLRCCCCCLSHGTSPPPSSWDWSYLDHCWGANASHGDLYVVAWGGAILPLVWSLKKKHPINPCKLPAGSLYFFNRLWISGMNLC